MSRLPEEPSALIRLALADLRQVEQDERYAVNMGEWHLPSAYPHGRCEVCLAGAVLAVTLGEPPDRYVIPSSRHGDDVRRKLEALNLFRRGMVYDGLLKMSLESAADEWLHDDPGIELRTVPTYSDPDTFHAAMGELADEMEMRGL